MELNSLAPTSAKSVVKDPFNVNNCNWDNKLPIVSGFVDGRRAKMLLDSGATTTLVHHRMVPKGKGLLCTNHRISGITGNELPVLGELDLDLTVNGSVINHRCLIVKEMAYDALIGYDLLRVGGFTIDFSEEQNDGKLQTAVIRVNKEMHIDPHSRKVMLLHPSRQLDACLEARVSPVKLTPNNVWTEESLCDVDSQGRVMVAVVNANPYTVCLRRRTCLAKVKSYQNLRPTDDISVVDWLEGQANTKISINQAVISQDGSKLSSGRTSIRSRKIFQQMDTESLTGEQKELVRRLVDKFPHSFSLDGEALPATSVVQYRIPTGDAIPVRNRAYRLPEYQKAPLKELITQLKKDGIIRPSNSNWSAPIIMIPKKQGGYRLVVDHRGLNKSIRRDNYPLPRIDDLLDELKSAKRFTTMDLRSGFHQVPIHPDDIHKTAFICVEGLFEYLRMSMGMANAPSCFQRLLETIFADMKGKGVLVYIDDLILYSETDEQHEILVEKVLRRLSEANLSLRPEKCAWFQQRVKYLGHLVTPEGIYPLYENIRKVLEFPVPQDVSQLRTFMGLASYYRKFIQYFSHIVEPLTDMTKKNKTWTWGSEEQKAFETIKNKLVNPPILRYPRYDSPFTLFTDASDKCIGAVLSQVQDGQEVVIAFGSRKLMPAELNYSTSEKECLSIVHFLGEYRHYLLGRKFFIETDHAPLTFLNRQKEPKGKLGRWAIDIADFDYEVKYRPGPVNKNADALSRLPVNVVENAELEVHLDQDAELIEALSVAKIKQAQQKDNYCQAMLGYLQKKELPLKDETLAKRVVWEAGRYLIRGDGVLTVIPDPKNVGQLEQVSRPVIALPKPLRSVALAWLHDHFSAGHLGFRKTLIKVQDRFYWPQMYSEVEKYTKSCVSCARVKTPPIKRIAPHATFSRATRPLERLIIDFVGPISPAARDGSTVILVVTDAFTRYAEAYTLPNQKTLLVAQTLVKEFFCRYGAPDQVHSDQGPNFMANLLKDIFKLYQSKHIHGSAWHPQSQGGVERQNRTLVESLKHYTLADVFEWNTFIPHAIAAYNSSVHASTLFTPYELFFGRQMRLPLDAMIHKPEPVYRDIDGYHEETAVRLHAAHQNARHHSAEALQAQAKYYNYRAKKRDFRVGDIVYVTNEARKAKRKNKKDCRKFRFPWLGPCKILEQIGEVVYKILHLDNSKQETVHENRLKLAFGQRAAPSSTTATQGSDDAPVDAVTRELRGSKISAKKQQEVADWNAVGKNSDSDSDSSSDDGGLPSDSDDLSDSSDTQEAEREPEHDYGQPVEPNQEVDQGSESTAEEVNPSEEGVIPPQLSAGEVEDSVDKMVIGGEPAELKEVSSGKTYVDKVSEPVPKLKSKFGRWDQEGRKGAPRLAPVDQPLLDKRKGELKRGFKEQWAKKVKHEKKNTSEYRIDFHKVAKRNPDFTVPTAEWEYMEFLKAQADEAYEDPLKDRVPARRSTRLNLVHEHERRRSEDPYEYLRGSNLDERGVTGRNSSRDLYEHQSNLKQYERGSVLHHKYSRHKA